MTEEFLSAIKPIRNQYVEGFADWVAEQAKTYPRGSAEHLYEVKAQTNFARKLCRVDYVLADGDNAQSREYSPKTMLGFQPMQGEVDGVTVQLHPFRWDSAVVEIPDAIWAQDATIDWFNRWFGFVGNTPAVTPRDKPGGCIHICAWAEPGMLRIDFGSASATALGELVSVAKASGATLISIRDASQIANRPGSEHVIG